MSRDKPEAERETEDGATDGSVDVAMPNGATGASAAAAAQADTGHTRMWLDIGKTVIAGVITAGILQFIRGGRR